MNIVFLCVNDNYYLPYFDIVGNVGKEEGNALYLPYFNFLYSSCVLRSALHY